MPGSDLTSDSASISLSTWTDKQIGQGRPRKTTVVTLDQMMHEPHRKNNLRVLKEMQEELHRFKYLDEFRFSVAVSEAICNRLSYVETLTVMYLIRIPKVSRPYHMAGDLTYYWDTYGSEWRKLFFTTNEN